MNNNIGVDRFEKIRELSREEKLAKREELVHDIEELEVILKDPETIPEQRNELYMDIATDEAKIAFIDSLLEEKHL